MQWQRIIDAKAVMGITRSRWLAVAVRAHSHVNTAPFPPWVFPQDHKIDHAQFLLPWNQKTLDALAITDEICRVASDPRKAGRTISAKSPEQVMQQRLYDTNMILPPFMARYGSQHELSDTHLNDHSYYGFSLRNHSSSTEDGFFTLRKLVCCMEHLIGCLWMMTCTTRGWL